MLQLTLLTGVTSLILAGFAWTYIIDWASLSSYARHLAVCAPVRLSVPVFSYAPPMVLRRVVSPRHQEITRVA